MPRKTGQHKQEGAPRLLRNDFLAANYAAQVAGRLRKDGWEGSDTEIFWRFAEKVDPTGREKDKPFRYLKWACGRYLETFKDGGKSILAEDLYKIREDLELFEDKKKRGLLKDGKADIQRYTVRTLADFTTELRGGALDGFDDMLAKAPESIMKETTIIYRGPEGIALTPHSREAAIHWSRGTRWCTGAENGDNQFFNYNIDGPLVIMFTATKERYQGHATSPVMDAQDREVPFPYPSPSLNVLLERIDGRFLGEDTDKTQEVSVPIAWKTPTDWSNHDYALSQIERYGSAIKLAAPELQTDKSFILEAVRRNGYALQFTSWEQQADKEIVLEAVRKNGGALRYAAQPLQADREIVLDAVRQDGTSLIHADEKLQACPIIVLAAVRQNGNALQFAAPALRSDRKIVRAAVRNSGAALRFASSHPQEDPKIVLEAVKQCAFALAYADYALRENCEFRRKALHINPEFMEETTQEEWKALDPGFKRESFMNGIGTRWTHIAYAADCGVTPSLAMQKKNFARARREDPKGLARALHLFPALRSAWSKRALTLDDAATLLAPPARKHRPASASPSP